MFEPEELAAVRRLAAEARASGETGPARTLETLLAKLEALAAGSSAPPSPLPLFEEILPSAAGAAPVIGRRVRHALERQEPIRIRYANRRGEVTTRTIRPFNIHFYDGQEYVEAFCELRGSDRIFALGSIEAVLAEETSTGPAPSDETVEP